MKVLLILAGLLLFIFIVMQYLASKGQRNIETYPYTVKKAYPGFEIRRYEASLFTSVQLPQSEYKKASSKGFSILAGYIFGGNEKKEKIAMTSPVAMSLEDSMTMMFLVPKQYDKASLPQPEDPGIEFKEMPAKTVAAITFGGWANDERIAEHKQRLLTALKAENIAHTNQFYFLGYNPPYEVFNRKNEIIVEIA